MDLADFDAFSAGYTLTLEERAVLEVEMAKRKHEEKLHSVRFWGRIRAAACDYLIVCGTVSLAEFPTRKWFFATSTALALQQLPEVTAAQAAKAAAKAGQRFTGDPGKPLEEETEENPSPLTEEQRLAWVVAAIERDTGVVPRGAFAVTPTHHIVPNPGFEGLTAAGATSLAAYQHFRRPEHPAREGALAAAALAPSTDFLDPLSEDVPGGVWAVQYDAGRGLARVASLRWLGYFAFHAVGTARHGAIYVGDGRPNTDLPFML